DCYVKTDEIIISCAEPQLDPPAERPRWAEGAEPAEVVDVAVDEVPLVGEVRAVEAEAEPRRLVEIAETRSEKAVGTLEEGVLGVEPVSVVVVRGAGDLERSAPDVERVTGLRAARELRRAHELVPREISLEGQSGIRIEPAAVAHLVFAVQQGG